MQLSIDIPLKPVTLNHVNNYRAMGKRVISYKSSAANKFKKAFSEQLTHDKMVEIESFALYHATLDNPCIVAGYSITTEKLLTAKGQVSKTCLDLENATKYATDLLFKEIKRFNKKCDDSQILMLFSDKWIGEDGIRIDLQAMELDEYKEKQKLIINM